MGIAINISATRRSHLSASDTNIKSLSSNLISLKHEVTVRHSIPNCTQTQLVLYQRCRRRCAFLGHSTKLLRPLRRLPVDLLLAGAFLAPLITLRIPGVL